MSKMISKLEEIMGQVQSAAGTHKQMMAPVLKKIGEVQALIDSYNSGSIDPQILQKLQAQIAAVKLDDSTVSAALAELHKIKELDEFITLKDEDVTKLINALRDVHTQITTSELDPVKISEIMPVLQQIFAQAESMLLAPIDLLNLNEGKILKWLQKL